MAVDGNDPRDDGKPMAGPLQAPWREDAALARDLAGRVGVDRGRRSGDRRAREVGPAEGSRPPDRLLEERRMYHRKDGKIVKLRDDLISALILSSL
jgi:hypothetical protein